MAVRGMRESYLRGHGPGMLSVGEPFEMRPKASEIGTHGQAKAK